MTSEEIESYILRLPEKPVDYRNYAWLYWAWQRGFTDSKPDRPDKANMKKVRSIEATVKMFSGLRKNSCRGKLKIKQASKRKTSNPGEAWHEKEALEAEERRERVPLGKSKIAGFYGGKVAAHRESALKAKQLKMNPIAIYNPKEAQLLYGRCLAVIATEHGSGHYTKERFRHDFKGRSRVEVLGLRDGSVLLRSVSGTRLWGKGGNS